LSIFLLEKKMYRRLHNVFNTTLEKVMLSLIENPMQHFVTPDHFKKNLEESLKPTWYGRNIILGLASYANQGGMVHKIKVYAAALFGVLFGGFTTFYSFDGSIRMVQYSLDEKKLGNPMPSDVGHGGEWIQQPFQYGLASHMFLFSAFANKGHLDKMKQLYQELIKEVLKTEEGKDITQFYKECEDDFRFLANRCLTSANLIQIKLELIKIFENINTESFKCIPLDLDRSLEIDYVTIIKELNKTESWAPSNLGKNLKLGVSLMRKRGVAQAIENGVCFSLFQAAMLATSFFMIWGMTRVVDEVFISKTDQRASGHLPEWSIAVFTNFLLMFVIYSWLFRKEVRLHRTHNVMRKHLVRPGSEVDLEDGMKLRTTHMKNHLIKTFNDVLDSLAEKCHYNTLPSQYRFKK
jgi:hypothetical protein